MKQSASPIEIHTEEDWRLAAETLQHTLRPNLNVDDFVCRGPQLVEDGYRLVVVFNELPSNRRVVCAKRCGRIFVHTRRMSSFYVKNGFDEYSTGLVKRLIT